MINKSISELYDSGYISGDAFLYYAERNLDTIQDIMDAGVLEEELAPYGKEIRSCLEILGINSFKEESTKECEILHISEDVTSSSDEDVESIYNRAIFDLDIRTVHALQKMRRMYDDFDTYFAALTSNDNKFWSLFEKLPAVGKKSLERARKFALSLTPEAVTNDVMDESHNMNELSEDQKRELDDLKDYFEAQLRTLSTRSYNAMCELYEICGKSFSSFVYDINRQNEIIKERLISPAMLSYSLLQGEAIDNIVDLSNSTNLAATVEALTDLSELKQIESTCKYLCTNSQKNLENKQKSCSQNKSEFEKAEADKLKIEKEIAKNQESISLYKKQLELATEKATSTEANLANTEKRVEYRERLKSLRVEKTHLEQTLSKLLSSINDNLFKKPIPWVLLNTKGFVDAFNEKWEQYREDMIAKKVTANPLNAFTSVLPDGSPDDVSLERMLKECHCLVCNRPFEKGDEHYEHVKMLRDRSKNQISQSEDKFKTFFGDILKNVSPYMTVDSISGNIAQCAIRQRELQKDIKEKEDEINRTLIDFANYGGSEADIDNAKDTDTLSAYNKALNDISLYNGYINSAQKRVESLREDLINCEKRMSEYGGAAVPQSYRDFKEVMQDVQSIFTNTKDRIYDEVLSSLEQKSNNFYQQLTAGNNVDGGKLIFSKTSYDAIQLKVINESGGEFTGASEGFQRMKKIAVVMAIVSSKIGGGYYDYPFIADAPFSAFGKNFITNFFETVPSVFRQCVIMIKDLYDINDPDFISDEGKKILKDMKEGRIKGTFYVNQIPEIADPTKLETKIHQYK